MNFSNDKIIIDNKILTFLVKKIKDLRKSFRKSNKKITSDDISKKNLNRTLSDLSIELDTIKSTTSSSKTYSKSNSSTYSRRDKSLDLIRVETDSDEYYNFNINKIEDLNYEIVLPYQRYCYKKNRN
tara:strand:+ start:357 stop:737 length:381 start_codon:yes stop_codon:yes gene_type:complete